MMARAVDVALRAPQNLEDITAEICRACGIHVNVMLRWRDDDVLVEHIYVPSDYRRRGLARSALEVVCSLLDLAGWAAALQVSDAWGSDKAELVRRYIRNGFVLTGAPRALSDVNWMRRSPRPLP
ncbi:GNAT family N-acetyltransferase [Rathayibacter rathayi]|nr:GNAT family N-acetyltransferase [Rathayibacter rathayi]